MINIVAKVGDELEVTLVRYNLGVRTAQRINGKQVFLDDSCRPGQTCVVRIVRENETKTAYFARIVSVVNSGDGTSLFEKVMMLINLFSLARPRGDRRPTERGIELAHAVLGDDKSILEFLVDLIDFTQNESLRDLINFECISDEATVLIEKVFGDDRLAAAGAYLRLGDALVRAQESQLGRMCLLTAFQYTQCVGGELYQPILSKVEESWAPKSGVAATPGNEHVQRALLVLSEKDGSVDFDRRLKIADYRLTAGDSEGARTVLKPILAAFESSHSVYHSTARLMAKSYGKERVEFVPWLLLAGDHNHEDHEAIADVLYSAGRYQLAADHFRAAYDQILERYNDLDD